MLTIAGPVILDLNSQRDLLAHDGAAPVFQPDKLSDPLRNLFAFALRNQTPVISTRFNHLVTPTRTSGIPGHSRTFGDNSSGKLICLPTAPGYQKLPYTLLRKRREWSLDCGTDLPVDGFRTTQQYIFDLPSLNLFECPRLDRLLSESTAEVFLVAGSPLEYTVRTTVLGMLARRHRVIMISDCLGMWDPYEGDMALRQIESKNVEWLTVEQVGDRFSQAARLRASRAVRAAARAQARMATVPPAPTKLSMKTAKGRSAFRV
jgi:nicotinamidase-related amidase